MRYDMKNFKNGTITKELLCGLWKHTLSPRLFTDWLKHLFLNRNGDFSDYKLTISHIKHLIDTKKITATQLRYAVLMGYKYES